MNSYSLYSVPKKAFDDVFTELKKAKKSIYMETYDIMNDRVSRELFRILARKSAEIKVVLIVDDFGFEKPSKTTKKLIESSNIEIIRYNPLWNALKEKHISKISRFVMRTHRKLTIVDEKVAYVGGMNYTAEELSWRDIFVKIKGTLVSDLTRAFFEMKRLATSKNIVRLPINKKLTKRFKGKDMLIRQIPHTRHKPFKRELKKLFEEAKKEIRITTPYFVPTVSFQRMMSRAIKRGVIVKILIPKKTDSYWIDIISDFFAFAVFGRKAEVYLQHQMTHAKYIVFDKSVCTFGSSNFDYVSFHNNHELNVITKEKKLINQLHKLFDEDTKKSTKYSRATRRNNSWFKKFAEKVMYRFRKFF